MWLAVLLASGVTVAHADSPFGPPTDDGSIDAFRHAEARDSMARGDFERARHLYYTILRTTPDDAYAQREAGRASHALGELETAIKELRRADELQDGAPDPELTYLLGEALYATGHPTEARAAHDRTLLDLGPSPEGRMERLWAARIHARRADLAAANRLYDSLTLDYPGDVEVAMARIEAHTLANDWETAESLARAFVAGHPKHPRGADVLAWVLEARGKLAEERTLRRELADTSAPVSYERTFAYGRSLERSRQYRTALTQYRTAAELAPDSDPQLRKSIDRLAFRLSPEATVGFVLRSDPSGTSQEYRTGAAYPIGGEHALSLTASYDVSSGERYPIDAATGTITASLLLGHGHDVTSALMVSGNYHKLTMEGDEAADTDMDIGSAAEVRLGTGRRLQLHARADLHMPWREAANTIREGGSYDGLTARAYALPFGHSLVMNAGVRVRRMQLDPLSMDNGIFDYDAMEEPRGSQTLLFGGDDWVTWVDPSKAARGEILDEELLWPTYMADALVIHYRHYEAFTDDNFGRRLILSERDSIDELGATGRKVLADGIVGFELRGGAGYDWAREVRIWRAGGAFLLSPATRTRLSFSYDLANESSSALVGRRSAGWFTLHVDL